MDLQCHYFVILLCPFSINDRCNDVGHHSNDVTKHLFPCEWNQCLCRRKKMVKDWWPVITKVRITEIASLLMEIQKINRIEKSAHKNVKIYVMMSHHCNKTKIGWLELSWVESVSIWHFKIIGYCEFKIEFNMIGLTFTIFLVINYLLKDSLYLTKLTLNQTSSHLTVWFDENLSHEWIYVNWLVDQLNPF